MIKRYGNVSFDLPDDGSPVKVWAAADTLSESDINELRKDLSIWSHENKLRNINNVMKSDTHKPFTMYGVKDLVNGWGDYIEHIVYKHINGKYYIVGGRVSLDPTAFNSVYYGIDINKLTKIPTRNIYSQVKRFYYSTPGAKYCTKKVNPNQIKLCIVSFEYNNKKYCEIAANMGEGKLYTYNKSLKGWEYLFLDRDDLTLNKIEVYPLKQTLTQKQFSNASSDEYN